MTTYNFETERHNHKRDDGISISLQLGKAAEHLVCAELILQGYNAFLADAGLPYDIVVDTQDKLYRLQVKATCQMLVRGATASVKRYVPTYRWALRRTRSTNKLISLNCDYLALVALDRRLIAFMPSCDIARTDGYIVRTIEMKTRSVCYQKRGVTGNDPNTIGKFMEDYAVFKIE